MVSPGLVHWTITATVQIQTRRLATCTFAYLQRHQGAFFSAFSGFSLLPTCSCVRPSSFFFILGCGFWSRAEAVVTACRRCSVIGGRSCLVGITVRMNGGDGCELAEGKGELRTAFVLRKTCSGTTTAAGGAAAATTGAATEFIAAAAATGFSRIGADETADATAGVPASAGGTLSAPAALSRASGRPVAPAAWL